MTIRGEERIVRGGVLFALADTLAAHSMGGFKVGVGLSLRKCRMCLATQTQIFAKVCEISLNTKVSTVHTGAPEPVR